MLLNIIENWTIPGTYFIDNLCKIGLKFACNYELLQHRLEWLSKIQSLKLKGFNTPLR